MDEPVRPAAAQTNNPALQRVLREAGDPALADKLAGLSGTALTTLLLEVLRRQAERLTPADVMRRYGSDRFVAPGSVGFGALRRAEDGMLAALPPGFDVLTLAPVLPLGAHSAVATVDPRNVVATVRGSEVAADPTNGLALEAAARRRAALRDDPRSAAAVRLAAVQRVVRAQQVSGPVMFAHFQLLGVVTAGRDTGGHAFEQASAAEHLRFAAEGLARVGAARVRIELTRLDDAMLGRHCGGRGIRGRRRARRAGRVRRGRRRAAAQQRARLLHRPVLQGPGGLRRRRARGRRRRVRRLDPEAAGQPQGATADQRLRHRPDRDIERRPGPR